MIQDAVENTKDMKATKGRASYVGERSIGHIDPGAYSSGLLFEAFIEARRHRIMSEYGIVIMSHSKDIAQGIHNLLDEVAKDVSITHRWWRRRWRDWNNV